METILVWTLVITAIAILLMLIMLIASERELKRKSAEVEALLSRYQANGVEDSVEYISAEQSAEEHKARYTEITALNQRLQSTIDTLRTELQRLRAENAGLRQKSKEIRGQGTTLSRGAASPKFPTFTLRTAGRRSKTQKRKWRNTFAVSAASLLLMAGVTVYFIPDWRETNIGEVGVGSVPSESQFPATLASTEISKPSDTPESMELATTKESEIPLAAPPVAQIPPSTTTKPSTPKIVISKTSAPLNASYEIIEPTRVFSEPSEGSRSVARVEAGTEINVVGVRGEWLEVRSRHGRPPGFVRRSTAVKQERN